jgi:hypothetical protein
VQRKNFVLFLKQPSPQLVDDCTCSTIPFPLYREIPVDTEKIKQPKEGKKNN